MLRRQTRTDTTSTHTIHHHTGTHTHTHTHTTRTELGYSQKTLPSLPSSPAFASASLRQGPAYAILPVRAGKWQ